MERVGDVLYKPGSSRRREIRATAWLPREITFGGLLGRWTVKESGACPMFGEEPHPHEQHQPAERWATVGHRKVVFWCALKKHLVTGSVSALKVYEYMERLFRGCFHIVTRNRGRRDGYSDVAKRYLSSGKSALAAGTGKHSHCGISRRPPCVGPQQKEA